MPSGYSSEMAERICKGVADGLSLAEVCAEKGMPGKHTVCAWLEDNERFREMYTRATEFRGDGIIDQVSGIVDDILSGALDANAGEAKINALKRKYEEEE